MMSISPKFIVLTFFLLTGLFATFSYSSSKRTEIINSHIVSPTPTPRQQLSISVDSVRKVSKDNSYDLFIVTTTIAAKEGCASRNPSCVFERNNFQIIDSTNQSHFTAAPPTFYIPGFQSRELAYSRILISRMSETGQLYFILPKGVVPQMLTFLNSNNQQITVKIESIDN